ncbi:uncharacterized protein ARMOST_18910 [Armillaria ostoyae]|uniref:Uncharacterized protein n=1 Tax=Armillaria ostoyae TaxID=47428 RepID=A0A284S318_ARMOS|nr:uncharacterized protein ARMOST_18910 [Armillaria ostoyae]
MPRTIESLTKENERLSNAIVDLRVQRDKFRQQVGKKRQELGKLQSEKERVDCEVADLRRRVSDLEECLADSRAAPLAPQGSEHVAVETVPTNKEAAPKPDFAEPSDNEEPFPSPGPSSIKNQIHLKERAIEIPSDSSDSEFPFLSPRTPVQKDEHKQISPKVIVSGPVKHIWHPDHTHGLQGHNRTVPAINFARPTSAKLRFKRPSSILNNHVLKRRKVSDANDDRASFA